MDLENSLLESSNAFGDARPSFNISTLKGVKRLKNKKWMQEIQKHMDYNVYPDDLYDKMLRYIQWVRAGGGDEWFVEI